MTHTIAPAAQVALDQASRLWPARSRLSDGLKGDTAHRKRRSWHNPCDKWGDYTPDGVVMAFDLTHDPKSGCDAHRLIRQAVARRDPRILEAISQERIWTRARASEGWRIYAGSNPHDKHIHVSLVWDRRNSTAPWWTAPQPAKEDDMTDADRKLLKEVHAMLTALGAPRRPDKIDVDKDRIALGDVITVLEK